MLTLAGNWMRPCPDCGLTVQSAGDWSVSMIRRGKVFRKSTCRACSSRRSVAYDRANPSKALERSRRRIRDWRGDAARRRINPERRAQIKRANVRRAFGISLEEYQIRFQAQAPVCPICGIGIVLDSRGVDRACLDHDHTTGRFRDFLCNRCNPLIGMAQEREDVLLRAAEYLRRHKNAEEVSHGRR